MASWYDPIVDVLGSVGRGVINAAPAAFQYLAARENSQTARDIAKVQSGASGPAKVATRVQQQRIQQGGGQPYMNFMGGAQNGGNILQQLGIQQPQQSGIVFDASTAVAPYIADKLGQYLFGPGQEGAPTTGGNGGVAMQMPGQYGMQCRRGGTALIQAPQAFTEGAPGLRARSTFIVQNPMTGNLNWYRNMGKPVLFSGDLAAEK
ncbi:unnamed protein product, partial [marine sediment metagenome]